MLADNGINIYFLILNRFYLELYIIEFKGRYIINLDRILNFTSIIM